jgi:dTDP-L-rhamnose 4-epimerase
LLRHGYRVRALDNLDPQIHGAEREPPNYLDRRVELIVGDIRSPKAVRRALNEADAVLHWAARVGVGQSMYEVADYTDVNSRGTAVLLEAMIERAKRRHFDRLVVASSMSIYGEGRYRASDGRLLANVERSPFRLKQGYWEPTDSSGRPIEAVPTDESKTPSTLSVYALSKYDQECLCLMVGGAYEIPTVALRFFNVYGPHQALSNPYSGFLAIFAARLLNERPPLIFENGEQRRDFVYAGDLAEACRLAMEVEGAVGRAFNIGSGRPIPEGIGVGARVQSSGSGIVAFYDDRDPNFRHLILLLMHAARNRKAPRRQEANNAERNQFNWLCNSSDDRAGSARGERLRPFFPFPAGQPASFCCFSNSPRRNLRNAATAASSALIPARFSAR